MWGHKPREEDSRQSTSGDENKKDNGPELELWWLKEPHQGQRGWSVMNEADSLGEETAEVENR